MTAILDTTVSGAGTFAGPTACSVIAVITDGCVNCAARREGISEVMRVHQRVLRTLRPVLITSPEDQPHARSPGPHRRPARSGPQRSLRSEAESSGVPTLPNVKTAR